MDPNSVIELVQHQLGIYDLTLADVTVTNQSRNRVELRGTINGERVSIEAESGHLPPDYACTIWLYDDQGEPVGRGNGGRSLAHAADIYQWQAVAHRYR